MPRDGDWPDVLGPVAAHIERLRRVLSEVAEMLAWLRAAGDVSDDVYVRFQPGPRHG